MELREIKISLKTFKLLEEYRNSFEESHDDIIYRVLSGRINESINYSILNETATEGLFWKGILIENGTELRGFHKGNLFSAEVKGGRIIFNGKAYKSPSAAAIEATGTNINGWNFWEYYDSELNKWEHLNNLRNKQ